MTEKALPDCPTEGGYPTDEYLEWIRNYDILRGDPLWFFRVLVENWWHGDYGCEISRKYKGKRTIAMSTLGWSGNEDVIQAMRENFWLWSVYWFSHKRGGHYAFLIEDK